MLKDERKEKIIEILKMRDYASVRYLCSALYASAPTVRRDLAAMEAEGLLRRSHGGAVLMRDDGVYRPLAFRAESMQREKRRIAQAAAGLVPDGTLLFLDASTTAASIIPCLREKRGIQVVTNGLSAMTMLQKYGIPTKCTGGDLLNGTSGLVGSRAIEFISYFNADICFFSTSSVDEAGRITDFSERENDLRRAMLAHARKSVYLFDHSKYGKTALYNLTTFDKVDTVVTDLAPPEGVSCQWIQV